MARALQIIIIGVLREPPVHKGPRQVIDRILLRLDRLCNGLRAHVVRQEVVEVRLDGQRLKQELLVKDLLGRVA